MNKENKILPPSIIYELLPPNKNYQYFKNWQEHPFISNADDYQPVNAWWLAEASLLAYADYDFAKERFLFAGMSNIEFFSGRSTECYVAYNDDFVIVSFRGTRLEYWDIVTDLKILLVEFDKSGKVHQGFRDALDEVWEFKQLKIFLDSILNDGRKRTFWFTGHSLGAALATLAAYRYRNVKGLYTFGSPKIGNKLFRDNFKINNTFRFTNNNDIVPRLPFGRPYYHVGNFRYIDRLGNIHNNPKVSYKIKDSFLGNVNHFSGTVKILRSGIIRNIPINYFANHAPIYYAIQIWNYYINTKP